jgi:hypothetical protein
MDLSQVQISLLDSKQSVRQFNCGVREVDSWARSKAHKWTSQNRTKVFVAQSKGNEKALGFYSLSFGNEDTNKLASQQELSRNANGLPIMYIGYLAVISSCQNCGLGKLLLIDALRRSHFVSQHVAFYGVGLRSLNDRTTALYKTFGFGVAPNEGQNPLMILPIWTLSDLFEHKNIVSRHF